MIDLLLIVVAVALVDALLNPTTIVPALYLATTPRPIRGILGFAAGAFLTGLVAGLVLLALGATLVDAVPTPPPDALHWSELGIGIAGIVGAGVLWRRRDRVSEGVARAEVGADRFAPLAGATIAAVELPTAFPYFAVIAGLAASDQAIAVQVSLLVLFNVLFLAPVFVIAAVRALAGRRADEVLTRIRRLVLRHSGAFVACLVLAVGLVLVVLGAAGLAGA